MRCFECGGKRGSALTNSSACTNGKSNRAFGLSCLFCGCSSFIIVPNCLILFDRSHYFNIVFDVILLVMCTIVIETVNDYNIWRPSMIDVTLNLIVFVPNEKFKVFCL